MEQPVETGSVAAAVAEYDAVGGPSRNWGEIVALIVLLAALAVAPFFVYPLFIMQALCFALFACAFNLLIGYAGLLSFGHALYFGWASYVAAHLAKVGAISFPFWRSGGAWQWAVIPLPPLPPELAILGGTLAAGILGLIAGQLAIRRQGIYFAMITLALAQMMYFFALQAKFTGGEDGIQGVPRGHLFGVIDLSSQFNIYVVVVVIFLAGFLLIHRIIHSPFGEVLKAIRENEPRAISLGYRTHRYKLMAFVLSATLAGLAGSTKAIVLQIASLTDVNWPMSGEVVLMALVGGLGTVFGPVAGAFILVAMQNYLGQAGDWVGAAQTIPVVGPALATVLVAIQGTSVIQGVIFVLCVMLFRRGVVGEIAHRLRLRL